MGKLYDISEVVSILGTTSRTLRFYESEGLIESTVSYPSKRRKYSEPQVESIKNILALRTLGLQIKQIKELLSRKCSLKDAIVARRIDIIRIITENKRQINLLEEVLHSIDGSVSFSSFNPNVVCTDRQLEISAICTDAILSDNLKTVIGFFSEDLKIILPETALVHSLKTTLEPLGCFVEKLDAFRDEIVSNIVIQPLKYEKCIFRLKYVFHQNTIHGFWTDYN